MAGADPRPPASDTAPEKPADTAFAARLAHILWVAVTAIAGIVLALFVLVQAGLVGLVVWAQTAGGSAEINRLVTDAMQGSGYAVSFDRLGYRPFTVLVVSGLRVTDEASGDVYAVDRAGVSLGLAGLLRGELKLRARINTLSYVAGGKAVPLSPLMPFEISGLPLRRITIGGIAIDRFQIDGDSIAEKVIARGDLRLTPHDVSFALEMSAGSAFSGFVPRSLSLQGSLRSESLMLSLDTLEIASPALTLSGGGTLGLGAAGQASVTLQGQAQLSPATVAPLTIALTGSGMAPLATVTAGLQSSDPALARFKAMQATARVDSGATPLTIDLGLTGTVDGRGLKASARMLSRSDGVELKRLKLSAPGLSASGDLAFPISAAGVPRGQVSLTVNSLAAYAPEADPTLLPRGKLVAQLSAPPSGGGIAARVTGTVKSGGGVFTLLATILADIDFNKLTLQSLAVTDRTAGVLSARGSYDRTQAVAEGKLTAHKWTLPRLPMLAGVVSGDLSLAPAGQDGYKLAGQIKPDRLDIQIPDYMPGTIPQLNVRRPGKTRGGVILPDRFSRILLDVSVAAKNRIFVRGQGLDAELGGSVAVTGDLTHPQVNGQFSSLRGRFEEFGKRFTIDRANLRFQGDIPPSPYLDVKADVKTDDGEASILLTGPASKPDIGLSSVPALPRDEVLSRILFGRSMRGLSPFEAIQLADTLRRLTGEGGSGFNPLQAFRRAVELDDLRVDQDASGGTTVGAGKYISDRVYLEVKTGQAERSGGASIQIDLTRRLKLESDLGQDKSGAGLSWSWDY